MSVETSKMKLQREKRLGKKARVSENCGDRAGPQEPWSQRRKLSHHHQQEEARVSIPQLLSSHHLICCAFYWWNPARSQREDKRASRDAVHSHRPLSVLDKKRRLAKGSVGETETSEYSHMRGKSVSSEDRAES